MLSSPTMPRRRPTCAKSRSARRHMLENDPEASRRKRIARARELLESGAALKQMQKISMRRGLRPAAPIWERLTFDVTSIILTERSRVSTACS